MSPSLLSRATDLAAARGPWSEGDERALRELESAALADVQAASQDQVAAGAALLRAAFEVRAVRQGLSASATRIQGTTAAQASRMAGEDERARAIAEALHGALPDDAPVDEVLDLLDLRAELAAEPDPNEAAALRGEAVDAALAAYGPADPRVGLRLALHGEALMNLDHVEGAEAAWAAAWQVARGLGGPDTPAARGLHANLANTWKLQGRVDEALAAEREILTWALDRYEAGHPVALDARRNLAVTLLERGDLPEARAHAEAALDGYLAATSLLHPDAMNTAQLLAAILEAADDEPAAAALLARMEAELEAAR
jgi:tetratricopeptide (TPR) repeat protein